MIQLDCAQGNSVETLNPIYCGTQSCYGITFVLDYTQPAKVSTCPESTG